MSALFSIVNEHERWKERLCIISTVFNGNSTSVFNRIQYSVYKMAVERVCKIELNTICTVCDSTRCVEWKVNTKCSTQHGVENGNSTQIVYNEKLYSYTVHLYAIRRVLHLTLFVVHFTLLHFPLLHFTSLHFRRVLHFTPLLHCTLFREWKGRNDPSIRVLLP